MKTFIICSDTNYDLMVHVVNAETQDEAVEIAKAHGAWDGCWAQEIDIETPGLVFNQ